MTKARLMLSSRTLHRGAASGFTASGSTCVVAVLLVAMGLLLISRGSLVQGQTAGGRSRPLRRPDSETVIQELKETVLPWQQYGTAGEQAAAPWGAYVDDLPGLLRRRCYRTNADPDQHTGIASCRWITIVTLNHMEEGGVEEQLLLNMLTSLVLVAQHDNYVVACATEQAVAACRRLRLPCYRAQGVVEAAGLNSTSLADGSLGAANLPSFWSKVAVARHVLRAMPRGSYLHVTDYDVVYLKKVYPSAETFFKKVTGNFADATMSYERMAKHVGGQLANAYIANTGVIFVRNTEMAGRMYDKWLAAATPAHHDQTGFTWQYGKAYMLCGDALTCELTGAVAGMPAVVRHHSPWAKSGICPDCKNVTIRGPKGRHHQELKCYVKSDPDHCSTNYRLYVHLVCLGSKVSTLQELGLWFIQRHDRFETNFDAVADAGLPCLPPLDVAVMEAV